MTRFSTNKGLFIFIHVATATPGTYVSLTIKKPKFVLLICLLPFLATKGSLRVLEKKMNETQVSKTLFSHLK